MVSSLSCAVPSFRRHWEKASCQTKPQTPPPQQEVKLSLYCAHAQGATQSFSPPPPHARTHAAHHRNTSSATQGFTSPTRTHPPTRGAHHRNASPLINYFRRKVSLGRAKGRQSNPEAINTPSGPKHPRSQPNPAL